MNSFYNSSDDANLPQSRGCFNCKYALPGLMSFYCDRPDKEDKERQKING